MTCKRQHGAGQCCLDGRDTLPGENFLGIARDALGYWWALTCKTYGSKPTLLVANGDSYESLSLDTTGDRSERWRYTNRETSRAVRTRDGLAKGAHVWAHGRPCETITLDETAEIRAILQLQDRFPDPNDWFFTFEDWGVEQTMHRPPETSDVNPATVTFTPTPPPALARHGVEEAKELVREAMRCRDSIREMLTELAEDAWMLRPTERPLVSFDAGDEQLIALAAAEFDQFQEDHEHARRKFKGGRRNVEFPAGTVFWRLRANVNVGDPPPGSIVLSSA